MHVISTRTDVERCYRILELDPGAEKKSIERSWRKLVDEWRPDRFASDPVLFQRAQIRIENLNQARELLETYLESGSTYQWDPTTDTPGAHRTRHEFGRRPIVASTVFAGVAIAVVLLARPLAGGKSKPAEIGQLARAAAGVPPAAPSTPPAALPAKAAIPATTVSSPPEPAVAPPPIATPEPELVLVAHAPVTVSASLVADGRILLPPTVLQSGQTATVPRLGPTYVKYSSGESLEVEIEGHRYPMPNGGASRAKIN